LGDFFVVDAFGYKVGKSGLKLVVKFSNGECLERSVMKFSTLILGGSGSISLEALKLLSSYNIPVVFISSGGAFATCHPFFMHGTVITRREQFLAYYDNRGLTLAKGFVTGALLNKSMVLKYFAKNRDESIASILLRYADRIDRIVERVKDVGDGDLDDLRFVFMGYEGEGSHYYYEALTRIIPKEFGFSGREKRPPRDPVNSLLSYGYIILNGIVSVAIAKAGLEPFAGFLHTDRSGKPSLVLDIAEEFRQPIVDVVVVSLFTRNWVSMEDFEFTDSGTVLIGKGGKRKFFERFRERLYSRVKVDGVNTTFDGAITRQARKIVKFLLRRVNVYRPFVFRWW
jgi:CRISPR-associated protein Cas1